MATFFISESVLEKTVVFAVGCALLVGGATTGGIATLATPGAALLAVLGAIGLRKIFQEKTEYEKVWKNVLARVPREFEFANDAEPQAVKDAADALEKALEFDGLFSVSQLERAISDQPKVVEGLIAVTISSLAIRDGRFADCGLPRDLANDLLRHAFTAALEVSSTFREQSILVIAQQTLRNTQVIEKQNDWMKQAISQLPTRGELESIQRESLEKIISELSRTQSTRGTSYLDSFFLITFDNESQTLGASIDNSGRMVAVSYGYAPKKVTRLKDDAPLEFEIIAAGDTLVDMRVGTKTSGIFGLTQENLLSFGQENYRIFDKDGNFVHARLMAIATTIKLETGTASLIYRDLIGFETKPHSKSISGPILDSEGVVVGLLIGGSELGFKFAIPWAAIAPASPLKLDWLVKRIESNS